MNTVRTDDAARRRRRVLNKLVGDRDDREAMVIVEWLEEVKQSRDPLQKVADLLDELPEPD